MTDEDFDRRTLALQGELQAAGTEATAIMQRLAALPPVTTPKEVFEWIRLSVVLAAALSHWSERAALCAEHLIRKYQEGLPDA